jgi:hypothetical protein
MHPHYQFSQTPAVLYERQKIASEAQRQAARRALRVVAQVAHLPAGYRLDSGRLWARHLGADRRPAAASRYRPTMGDQKGPRGLDHNLILKFPFMA